MIHEMPANQTKKVMNLLSELSAIDYDNQNSDGYSCTWTPSDLREWDGNGEDEEGFMSGLSDWLVENGVGENERVLIEA